MATESTASDQDERSSQPANVPDIDEKFEEVIRGIDNTWNDMLAIRHSIAVSRSDDRQEFIELCRTMNRHVFEMSQPKQWEDLQKHLKEDWETLQIEHRLIDWDAMERLRQASQEFQERLSSLPWLLERICEDAFPPSLERWPASLLAQEDRMEALEGEVQRLQAILRGLGGCGEGIGCVPHCA